MQKLKLYFSALSTAMLFFSVFIGSQKSFALPQLESEWILLGEMKNIIKFVPTTKTFQVSRDRGRLWELSVTAAANAVRVHSLYLTFADGQTQSVPSFDLEKGDYQTIEIRPVDSPYLRRIEVSAETNSVSGSRADLIIEGR